jgi:hypothetical protein
LEKGFKASIIGDIMAESYGTPDEFVNNTPIMGYEDDSGIVRFMTKAIASNNFDGWISGGPASVSVSDVIAGQLLGISSGSEYVFYPILSVSKQDPLLELGSYTGETTLYYVDSEETKSVTYASSATQVVVIKEDFSDKTLGSAGWYISQEGNAIFTNVAVRGRIEATSGYIGDSESGWEIGANLLSNASVGFYAPSAFTGSDIAIFSGSPFTGRATAPFRVNYAGELSATGASISGALTATTLDVGGSSGIVYNGSAVTIGASVNILAPVTVNSLQVGASPTLLRISNDVNGTNDGIYIDANNYWYSDGQFGVGGSANNVVWSGSTLTVTGSINATNITASVGNVGGFNLSRNQLSTASVIVSSSGGFRLGNPTIFSVDQFGNMRATSASITGDITATSGRFTGSVVAQHITASTGTIAGWGLSASILSGTNASIVSTGDIILGTGQNVVELSSSDANFRLWAGSATPTNAPFRVTSTGGLVATSASITGNITAQSGLFTGSVVAQHITASTGTIAGFTLANNQMSTSSVVVSSSGGFRLGNPAVFSVDQFGNLVANTASISGRINATSGSFSGDITASAGRFVGAVSVSSSGAIFAGSSVDSGQRTVLNASGLFGFHSNGLEAFALPVSGSPRLGTFRIIPTGIVSQSASNANMIYGNVDSSGSVTDGIVIRGFRSVGASAAIYNVQNGVATSYSTGNGFYVDENARFKLKGATGSLAFDGTDLYIDGNINARSGNFTGSVRAQHITASVGSIAGFTLSNNQMSTASVVVSSSGGFRLGNPTIFSVDQFGNLRATSASITGNITANSGQFTGSISAQHITASVGSIAGFTLANNQMSTASVIVSSSGGFRLGNPTVFSVNQFGNLVANSASIIGNINAQSGSFTGTLGVFGSGKILAQSSISNQRIEFDSTDLVGYSVSDSKLFKLTTGDSASTITNGGFDTGSTSPWRTFWGYFGVPNSATIDSSIYYSGGYSIKTSQSPGYSTAIDQNISLVPGQEYIISAWVRSASNLSISSNDFIDIWILSSSAITYPDYFQSGSTVITSILGATELTANTWTKVSGRFTPRSSIDLYNSIHLRTTTTSASTTVWWDSVDVSLSNNYSEIAGFKFNDGMLFTDALEINADGKIIVGQLGSETTSGGESNSASGILGISGTNPSYRLWVGNVDPTKSLMNITPTGTININSGGDLILSSSPVGTSDADLSKLSFRRNNSSTNQARVEYVPSSSWMNVGIATGADTFRQLRLTAGTTGSITLRGTVMGLDSNFVLDQTNTRIGIGTLSPTNTLTVVGTASISSTLSTGGNTTITGGLLSTNRNVGGAAERGLRINSTNNYTTNWNAIEFQRNGVDLGFIRVASAAGAPTLVSASDYRLKKNIEDDTRDFSNIINSLRPVTFEWKNIENTGKTYGFIAHEVQKYIPEAVGGIKDDVDENGEIIPQDLTQQPFVYYLVGAFKEALKDIDILKQRVLQLESIIERNNNV